MYFLLLLVKMFLHEVYFEHNIFTTCKLNLSKQCPYSQQVYKCNLGLSLLLRNIYRAKYFWCESHTSENILHVLHKGVSVAKPDLTVSLIRYQVFLQRNLRWYYEDEVSCPKVCRFSFSVQTTITQNETDVSGTKQCRVWESVLTGCNTYSAKSSVLDKRNHL